MKRRAAKKENEPDCERQHVKETEEETRGARRWLKGTKRDADGRRNEETTRMKTEGTESYSLLFTKYKFCLIKHCHYRKEVCRFHSDVWTSVYDCGCFHPPRCVSGKHLNERTLTSDTSNLQSTTRKLLPWNKNRLNRACVRSSNTRSLKSLCLLEHFTFIFENVLGKKITELIWRWRSARNPSSTLRATHPQQTRELICLLLLF